MRAWALDQSQPAFAELVRRHLGMVHATAMRDTGDAELAGDVSQAVFLVLSRKAARLTRSGSLAGWLFRATRYAAANARQLHKRRDRHERRAAEMRPEMTPEQLEEA